MASIFTRKEAGCEKEEEKGQGRRLRLEISAEV